MPTLLANIVTPLGNLLLPLGTILAATSAGWFTAALTRIILRPAAPTAESWMFDAQRHVRLRAGSRTFRWLEPLVLELQASRLLEPLGWVERVGRSLDAGASPLPWQPREFLATAAVKSIALGFIVAALLWFFGGRLSAAIVGTGICGGLFVREFTMLQRAARRRIAAFKRRLPYAIDLLALMVEAGAGFRDALTTIALEHRDHPLGQEFGKVLQEIERGQTLRQALTNLQLRLRDDDLSETVFAMQKAEELGTPLAQILLQMADQMRLKRSQWAERDAGKAKATITFPGLVVMLACVLIIVAPFVLNAVWQYSGTK